jgi:hypothetical protein
VGLTDHNDLMQTPNGRLSSASDHDNFNLFSIGSAADGWKRSFREAILWSLLLVAGCRPPALDKDDYFDPVPQRAIPTARLNPGTESSGHEHHRPVPTLKEERMVDDRQEAAWVQFVDRYEPLLVDDLQDRIVLEAMMLSEQQISDILDSSSLRNHLTEGERISVLCNSAVTKGYVQADQAEHAYHTYLYIKARALCTDMLEVQLSGYQQSLSSRSVPTASSIRIQSDDPIREALHLLTAMSEAILLKANERAVGAQEAAAATHPGTVMARDLARMLVEPTSIGDHTRRDLESMAAVTLETYQKVTNDDEVNPIFADVFRHALNATLARRAGLTAERLRAADSSVFAQDGQSNLLVHFDVNGDGVVTRSELTPLGERYNSELVDALGGLKVPTSSGRATHQGEH